MAWTSDSSESKKSCYLPEGFEFKPRKTSADLKLKAGRHIFEAPSRQKGKDKCARRNKFGDTAGRFKWCNCLFLMDRESA